MKFCGYSQISQFSKLKSLCSNIIIIGVGDDEGRMMLSCLHLDVQMKSQKEASNVNPTLRRVSPRLSILLCLQLHTPTSPFAI